MTWKRYIIAAVSVVCIVCVAKLVIACADDSDPFGDDSFFLNTINKEPAFVPFYYSASAAFYTDGYYGTYQGPDYKLPDQNIALWKAYAGNEVAEQDLDSFVYSFSLADVNNLYDHVQKGTSLAVPAKVSANAFTGWLLRHKDAEALQYLVFAKTCQPYTIASDANWDNAADVRRLPYKDSLAMTDLVAQGQQLYSSAKNISIKDRYSYQILRMAFYGRHYAQVPVLFGKLIPARKDNCIYYRSVALKAGALYKAGEKTDAAYLYSILFDNTDDNKQSIYTSFRWAINGNINSVLTLCKNDHEKAVVYIMQGLYDYTGAEKDMVSALQNAYRLDPKVKGLDIVMTRCINRMEREMIPGIATGANSKNETLAALKSFAARAAADAKAGTQAYWLLCQAYISLLQDDRAACSKYLVAAKAQQMTSNEEEVHAIISVLYTIRKDGKITPATEDAALPALKGMEAKGAANPTYASLFSNFMVSVLVNGYLAQGDKIKAVYCYSRTGYANDSHDYMEDYTNNPGQILDSMTPAALQTVEAFMAKKDKTPFEHWLTEKTIYTLGALKELEGTQYIRMYQFDNAAATLAEVPDTLLKKRMLPDVMISHILDGQEWNKSDSGVAYNKLQFARKMLELQKALESNPKDGRAAYQYANGLYNMTYYGKAHHAYDYYRTGTDQYAYFTYKNRKKLTPFALEHYNAQTPEKYYMQAYENSADREVKARCLFMAAKCWQKNCPVRDEDKYAYYSPDEKAYYLNTFKNPHLQQLKNNYRDTRFFSSATGTCSYFRDYVSKK